MKKRIVAIAIMGATLVSLFTGCGSKAPAEEPATEEEVAVEAPEAKEYDVDFRTITEEEYYNLPIDVFAEAIQEQLPDWRDKFAVSQDLEMTEDRWRDLKELMFYSLFGYDLATYINRSGIGESEYPAAEVEEFLDSEELDEEEQLRLYVFFTEEFLDSMTDEEFFEWKDKWYEYTYNKKPEIIMAYYYEDPYDDDSMVVVAEGISDPSSLVALQKYLTPEQMHGVRVHDQAVFTEYIDSIN